MIKLIKTLGSLSTVLVQVVTIQCPVYPAVRYVPQCRVYYFIFVPIGIPVYRNHANIMNNFVEFIDYLHNIIIYRQRNHSSHKLFCAHTRIHCQTIPSSLHSGRVARRLSWTNKRIARRSRCMVDRPVLQIHLPSATIHYHCV